MSKTIAVHVRYKSLYISLPSSQNNNVGLTKFCVVYETWTTTANWNWNTRKTQYPCYSRFSGSGSEFRYSMFNFSGDWGLPSTLIRRIFHRKWSFSKTLLKTEEFENGALRFTVDGKHFENGAFRNDDVTIIRWFVCPSLPQTQIQNGGRNGDCYAHAHGCT